MKFSTKPVSLALLLLVTAFLVAEAGSSTVRGSGGDGGTSDRRRLVSLEDVEDLAADAPTGILHLVKIEDGFGKTDLDTAVETVGGSVLFYHDETSIAVVQGLETESAFADVQALDCVAALVEDTSFTLDDTTGETAAFDNEINDPNDPTSAFFYAYQ